MNLVVSAVQNSSFMEQIEQLKINAVDCTVATISGQTVDAIKGGFVVRVWGHCQGAA